MPEDLGRPQSREHPEEGERGFEGESWVDAGPLPVYVPANTAAGRAVRLRIAAIAFVLVVLLLAGAVVAMISASENGQPSQIGPESVVTTLPWPSPAPESPTAGMRSRAPVVFKAVDRLCEAADLTALEDRFGPRAGVPLQRADRSRDSTSMWCTVGFSGGLILIQALIMNNRPSQALYDELRRQQQPHSATTDVAGVGSGAYTYRTAVGTFLVAHAGNLYITVLWSTLDHRFGTPAPNVTPVLTQVCRVTMANLAA